METTASDKLNQLALEKQAFLGTALNAAKPLFGKAIAAAKPLAGNAIAKAKPMINKGTNLVSNAMNAASKTDVGQRAAKMLNSNPTIGRNAFKGMAAGSAIGGIQGAINGAHKAKENGTNTLSGTLKGVTSGTIGGGIGGATLGAGGAFLKNKTASESLAELCLQKKAADPDLKAILAAHPELVSGAFAGGISGAAVGFGGGGYRGFRKAQKNDKNKVVGTLVGAGKGALVGAATGTLAGAAAPAVPIIIEEAKKQMPHLFKKADDNQEEPDSIVSVQTPGSIEAQILTAQPDGSIAEQISTQTIQPSVAEQMKQDDVRESKKGSRSVLPNGLTGAKRRLQSKSASDLSETFGMSGVTNDLSKIAQATTTFLEALVSEYDDTLMKEADAELTRVMGESGVPGIQKIKRGPGIKPTPQEAEQESVVTPSDVAEQAEIQEKSEVFSG